MSDSHLVIGKVSQDVYTTLQKRRYDFERYLLDLMPDYQSQHEGSTRYYSNCTEATVDENQLSGDCCQQKNVLMANAKVNITSNAHNLSNSTTSIGVDFSARVKGGQTGGYASTQNMLKQNSESFLATKSHVKPRTQLSRPVAENDQTQLYMKTFKDGYVIHMSDNRMTEMGIRKLSKISMDMMRMFDVRIYKIYINNILIFDVDHDSYQLTCNAYQDCMIDLKV